MKKILSLCLVVFFSFILISCSSGNADIDGSNQTGGSEYTNTEETDTTVERKIIYKVYLSMYIDSISNEVRDIKSKLNPDEWLDNEYIGTSTANLTIRVKTTRLDSFLNSIMEGNNILNYQKSSEDISNTYVDTEQRITALELQIDRLIKLYENANINEMIIINQQLSDAQAKLQRERGQLSQFDSLVAYSTVTISLQSDKPKNISESFWDKIVEGFINGWEFMIRFIEFFIIAIATVLPISLVVLPILLVVVIFRKKIIKKKPSKIRTLLYNEAPKSLDEKKLESKNKQQSNKDHKDINK